ncbi:hypothetical protein P9B58_06105 [Bacillus mojavensis]|nr:hypothetical protein [Bacillus mojavensis]MEC1289827.1 hypothetical protein [Bacillus mojavensis]MEC1702919.1 hypothetical protein [Bacillus mojavensis]MEC5248186.1 hypothetical protein [Bacillus mojavensis]
MRSIAASELYSWRGVSGWMWEEQISDFQLVHYPWIAAGSANAV